MKQKINSTDPDILGSYPAMKRAAAYAKKLALATNTPLYVWQNGRVVNLNKKSRKRAR
jgi:hypothetical protein